MLQHIKNHRKLPLKLLNRNERNDLLVAEVKEHYRQKGTRKKFIENLKQHAKRLQQKNGNI